MQSVRIDSRLCFWQGITGRRAPEELMRIADLINEVKKIKHYFNRVVKARTEIER
jgi:cob(I)alamin adenosyltransferase